MEIQPFNQPTKLKRLRKKMRRDASKINLSGIFHINFIFRGNTLNTILQ